MARFTAKQTKARRKARKEKAKRSKSSRKRSKSKRKPIVLKSKKRKRAVPKSKFLRVLTSGKTTLALAGILGALVSLPLTATRASVAVGARVLGKRAVVSSGRGIAKGLSSIGKAGVGAIAKRPLTSIVAGGILVSSGTARRAVVKAPKTAFGFGKTIGTGIEGLTPEQKEKGGKFGIAGLIATTLGVGLVAVGVGVGAKKIKDKVLAPSNFIPVTASPVSADATTIQPTTTAITTPLVSLDEPKPIAEKKPTQPRRAKITQNVDIRIAHSQNRKFINQINY